MTRWRQWGKATRATMLGWAMAFLLTSPIQMIQVIRSSGHDLQLILAALGFGLFLWLVLTLVGVLVVWLCVVSPIALLCSREWLMRYRCWVIAAAIVAGILAASYISHLWLSFDHAGAGAMNYWAGVCFAVIFPGVTVYRYLRRLTSPS